MTRYSLLIVSCIVTLLSGCMIGAYEYHTSKQPTYQEIEKMWPTLDENTGRLVFYCPQYALGGMANTGLKIDDNKYVFPAQSFFYLDMPVGSHIIEYYFRSAEKVTVNLKGGDIVYISALAGRSFSNDPPTIVDKETAIEYLTQNNIGYTSKFEKK